MDVDIVKGIEFGKNENGKWRRDGDANDEQTYLLKKRRKGKTMWKDKCCKLCIKELEKKISEKSKLRRKKFLNGSSCYFTVKFHFSKSFCTS